MSYTLGMSDWYIVANIFRNVTAMLETEVQDFYFVDIFNNPIQLIWVLPFWHKVKFWCLHQALSCCLSLSCVWSTILWSNCRPKMGRKLSDMCSCTSLCIHHTQLCHDEGTSGVNGLSPQDMKHRLQHPHSRGNCIKSHSAIQDPIKYLSEELVSWLYTCSLSQRLYSWDNFKRHFTHSSIFSRLVVQASGGTSSDHTDWICEKIFPSPKWLPHWLVGITRCEWSSLVFSMRKACLT